MCVCVCMGGGGGGGTGVEKYCDYGTAVCKQPCLTGRQKCVLMSGCC